MEVHVVQKGDTLWKISRQYGISFEDLKRVNAHLANPDYIVPGMKIFLPNNAKGEVKQQGAGDGHVQKTEKAPVKKPQPPKEELRVPKQPKPIPEVPIRPPVESKPVPPKPQVKPESPVSKPMPPKEPITPPVQSQPTPPVSAPPMQPYPPFSVIGIPCGWLPIYDADCYPHMHPSQMQPMPSPMPQLPVQPESSHFPGHHLPTKPTPPKITDDWKMIESPKIEDELVVQRPKRTEPKTKSESIPEVTPIPLPQRLPQYEMPMPQPVSPMQQNHWRCMQCGGQPSYSGHSMQCGCGSFQPMPMPTQYSRHCNTCQQPMQMMPFPNQNNHWYGTH